MKPDLRHTSDIDLVLLKSKKKINYKLFDLFTKGELKPVVGFLPTNLGQNENIYINTRYLTFF